MDPDYGDIWKTVCGLGYNAYNENLFEVANGVGYSGDIGTLMGRAMDGNLGYGQRGFGGTYVSTNAYYFYSFDRADKRRDYACYWPTYKKDSDVDGGNREVMNNDIMNVRLGNGASGGHLIRIVALLPQLPAVLRLVSTGLSCVTLMCC